MKTFFPIFGNCYTEKMNIGYIVGADWVLIYKFSNKKIKN